VWQEKQPGYLPSLPLLCLAIMLLGACAGCFVLILNSKPSFAFAIMMATNNNLGYFLYNTIYQHMT
jgi:hypothetical protein